MRSTWAPKGQTPVLHHHLNWKRLSMSAALCFRANGTEASLVFGMQPGAYNDESLMEFLTELHRHLDGDKVTLIWDGLPSHRSRAMQAFLRKQRRWLVVERLPAYAPDLNPIEKVGGNLKGTELANYCPDTIDEAEEIVDRASAGSAARPSWPSHSSTTAASSYNRGQRGITRRSLEASARPAARDDLNRLPERPRHPWNEWPAERMSSARLDAGKQLDLISSLPTKVTDSAFINGTPLYTGQANWLLMVSWSPGPGTAYSA